MTAVGRLGRTVAAVVLTALLVATSAPAARRDARAFGTEWSFFREAGLGFTFAYPPGWTARPGCHGSRLCVALSDGPGGVDDYALALEIFVGGLERTATDKAVFRHAPNGWLAEGRFASQPAQRINAEGWRGLQAIIECGVSGDVGSIASGECLWAVLSDGRMSVVADTQGTRLIGGDVRRIIQSVRFVQP